MTTTRFWRAMAFLIVVLALSAQGLAQPATPKAEGVIDDYSAAAGGPWHVAGEWSLSVKGDSGKVDFVAALIMMRSDSETRSPHTHHIYLTDAIATPLANGYRISGPSATITSNGALAPFSGTPLEVEISGGSAVPFANVKVAFSGAAADHFGADPIDGVVTKVTPPR